VNTDTKGNTKKLWNQSIQRLTPELINSEILNIGLENG